jgi:protein phosphatase
VDTQADDSTHLTRDHSVVSELIERGRITPEEARDHAASGQLTRYIGMEEKTRSHVHSFALKRHDRILVCTDGLTDMLGNNDIAAIPKAEAGPRSACTALVATAKRVGGHDNITALVIDWMGPG